MDTAREVSSPTLVGDLKLSDPTVETRCRDNATDLAVNVPFPLAIDPWVCPNP